MNRKLNVVNILYMLLMMVTIFFIVISNRSSLKSSIVYSVFLLAITVLLIFFNQLKNEKLTTKEIFLLCINLLLLFISIIITGGGLGSVFFIFSMLLVLIGGPKIKVSYRCIIYTFIFSFLALMYQFTHTYNSINTNDASHNVYIIFLLVMVCFNYIYDRIFKKKRNIMKLAINFIMLFVLISNISKYDSRNVLLCSLVFFILSFLPLEYQKKKTKKWSIIVTSLLSFGSLIIVFFYLYMYTHNYNFDLSFISNKKLYSGREVIWDYLFTLFKDDRYIWGIGSKLGLYDNMGAHNYMYSILILFGVPNFLLFVILLKGFFTNIISKLTFNNKNIYAAIISLFVSGFFETTFIASTNISVLLLLSIVLNSINHMDEEGSKLEKKDKSITLNKPYE